MDLTDSTDTLARTKEWVLSSCLRTPAETAFAVRILSAFVVESRWHGDELLELLLIGVSEDTVCTVALLLIGCVHVHRLHGISDLFDSEFDTTNLEDVSLLDLIVLYNTYDV